ncbi:hypothetical protein RB195_017369 [Necator americanus]|uniref:SCP domain-containing protein n=2 Tax=Necator americanus TaxID=51031 RepID=A0ABR1C818_NECAM
MVILVIYSPTLTFRGEISTLTISCCAALLTLVTKAGAADEITSFGCRDSLISDEWRTMVLKYHNDKRRSVSRGDEPNKTGTLKPAKKINELTWDCNLERTANEGAAKCADYADNQLGVNQETISTSSNCNITEETEKVLSKWWSEVTTNGLADDLKYKADSGIQHFANMVFFNTNAFACSYTNCKNGLKLLCLYNKNGNQVDKKLYYAAASKDVACDNCDANVECVNMLCQPPFTLSADNPLTCADDAMTNDMTNTALYMHNYYRGLLGSGWAEDKIRTYALLPKKMPQLEYGCSDLGKEAAERAAACKETPDDPTDATRSQNYHVINDVQIDKQDALKQAISAWWKELADVGLGEDTKYKAAMKDTLGHFANMAYDQTTKVGCSVETCSKPGFTLVVCQYDKKVDNGKNIYEAAKSGDAACSGCTDKKCGSLEGLCAP